MTVETITSQISASTDPTTKKVRCVLCDAKIERPSKGWLPSMNLMRRRLKREPQSEELTMFVFCGSCGRELRKQNHDTFSFSKVQHVLREEERARAKKREVLKVKFSELFVAKVGNGNGKAKAK